MEMENKTYGIIFLLQPMLVWYMNTKIGINIGMNIGIKYQTNWVWLKSSTNLIPIQVGRDLK